MINLRIGFGVDVHQLRAGLPLMVGGIEVPSDFGALGHSDADVLVHVICDALLGAANLTFPSGGYTAKWIFLISFCISSMSIPAIFTLCILFDSLQFQGLFLLVRGLQYDFLLHIELFFP
ncbi:MAG: hypothetical protein EBS55_04715 [Flavobacteriaceae bacterium]|nr:hypothetical protein [Flavobacteriaceae bacterium]